MMPQCDKKECGGRRFPNENLLAKHVAQQHSQQRILFKFHLCEKKFIRKDLLKNHVLLHNVPGSACSLCGKWLKTEWARKSHEDWHYKVKSNTMLKCHLCSYSNCRPASLNYHMKIVHGPPQFGCQLCDKKFRSIGGVKKHRNHSAHLSSLKRLGLVDVWRMKEERWGSSKWSGGTYLEWGKMNQFVSKEEAARIIEKEEQNTTVVTVGV